MDTMKHQRDSELRLLCLASSRRSITNLQPPLGLGTSKAGAPHSEVIGWGMARVSACKCWH